MSETESIIRTIARLHKPELLGITSKDQANVEMIFSFLMKWWMQHGDFSYFGDHSDEGRRKFFEDGKAPLERLNAYLGYHKFFGGDQVTIADIALYEIF